MYTEEFIVVTMRHAFPTPAANMQPHIIRLPPPNFFVGMTTRASMVISPAYFQHHARPLGLTHSSFVSSEKMTFSQSLAVQ